MRQPKDPSSAVGIVHMLIKIKFYYQTFNRIHYTQRLPAAVSPSPFILIMFSSIVPSDWPACLIDLTSGFFFFSLSKLHINWEEFRERQLLFFFCCAFVRRRILVTWYTNVSGFTGLLLLAHDYQFFFSPASHWKVSQVPTAKHQMIKRTQTRVDSGLMFDGFMYQ